MIDWTDAAIEAADKAYHQNLGTENSFEFWRTVLDAAVKAQFREPPPNYAYQMAYSSGRADALEEAAKVAEMGEAFQYRGGSRPQKTPSQIAYAIRALKEKQG